MHIVTDATRPVVFACARYLPGQYFARMIICVITSYLIRGDLTEIKIDNQHITGKLLYRRWPLWFVTPDWRLVAHICVSELGCHYFRKWVIACSMANNWPDQCACLTLKWISRNKFLWSKNQNTIIFIHLCIWKMSALCSSLNVLIMNFNRK